MNAVHHPRRCLRPETLPLLLAATAMTAACDPSGSVTSPSASATATAAAHATTGPSASAQPEKSSEAPLLTEVEDLALGSSMDCALRKDQTVWCWGDDRVAKPTPAKDAKRIAVVDAFVCVIAVKGQIQCALAKGGEIIPVPLYRDGVTVVGHDDGYCVNTEDGVLRCGLQDREGKTVKPPSGMPGLKDSSAFAIGQTLGFAVLDGAVWGWNNEGGAGVPRTMAAVADAAGVAVGRQRACVHTTKGELHCYRAALDAKPAKVAGWSDIKALSMAYDAKAPDRLCALNPDGTVGCSTLSGEDDSASFPAPKQVAGLKDAVQLGTGSSTDRCARTKAGQVYCWGPTDQQAVPVRVAPPSK